MTAFRSLLFWLHLTAGILAGLVVLVMSATGVALTYEKQILEWADSDLRSTQAEGARRLSPSELLQAAGRQRPEIEATGVTLRAAADAPASVSAGRDQLYLDAYTGQVLGAPRPGGVRGFMTSMRSWHRWLAVEDPASRTTARAITGWSNVLFLFLVVSGIYLWLPRVWTRASVAAVAFFKRSYGTGKARDFNWHNVIGIWSAVPLFIVVLSAVPISFPWASDLVYRAVGEEPPARGGEGGRGREGGAGPATRGGGDRREAGRGGGGRGAARERAEAVRYDGWDLAAAQVATSVGDWRTLTIRREGRAQVAVAIDRGLGGQPQLRSTATFDGQGRLVSTETFGDQSLGRRIRSIMRFAHTGEVLGWPGQTVAGLVSAGAVVMVWTGLALSWRRFRAWITRTSRTRAAAPAVPAAVAASRTTAVVPEEFRS